MKTYPLPLSFIGLSLLILSCNSPKKDTLAMSSENVSESAKVPSQRSISEEFKTYWYAGTAEITSYQLTQERYGELREGKSVNIFVTEDFLQQEQVKADQFSKSNIPVLKLNNTKKFLTGIYPYSLMTSTFSPVYDEGHALKVTHSMQEWCGQVYIQLNNKRKFEVASHSYFQGEGDQDFTLDKTWLENEIWNLIRINPEELPTGDLSIIPAFEYTRMGHKDLQAYDASAILEKGDNLSTYRLTYPSLKRELRIYFSSTFPYAIESWEETHANGLVTKANKIKRIQSPYWGKNSNKDLVLRDSLGL